MTVNEAFEMIMIILGGIALLIIAADTMANGKNWTEDFEDGM